MCQEQNKMGWSCSYFYRDERIRLTVYKVVRSAIMQIKSSLSLAKLHYRWARAIKYNLIIPPSRWLAEWFQIVLLNSTIGSHSANQRLGGLIGWTSTAMGTPSPSPHPRLFPLVWMGDSYLGIIFDSKWSRSSHLLPFMGRKNYNPKASMKNCRLN